LAPLEPGLAYRIVAATIKPQGSSSSSQANKVLVVAEAPAPTPPRSPMPLLRSAVSRKRIRTDDEYEDEDEEEQEKKDEAELEESEEIEVGDSGSTAAVAVATTTGPPRKHKCEFCEGVDFTKESALANHQRSDKCLESAKAAGREAELLAKRAARSQHAKNRKRARLATEASAAFQLQSLMAPAPAPPPLAPPPRTIVNHAIDERGIIMFAVTPTVAGGTPERMTAMQMHQDRALSQTLPTYFASAPDGARGRAAWEDFLRYQ
jgi:hypothetical protein